MKKKQVIFYIVLMLMLLCTSVYATISGSISLTLSTTDTLSAGKEFTVTLSLGDISASSGITSVNGYINIDENVLEDLTVSSIVTNSSGYVEINSSNILSVYDASTEEASSADTGIVFNTSPKSGNGDYRIVINLASAITSDTDLVTITFKVKSGVTVGTYKDAISYTLFKIYSGVIDKDDVTDKSLDITIGSSSSNNGNTDNNAGNNVDNNVENNVDNNAGNNIENNVGNNIDDNSANGGETNNSENINNNAENSGNTSNKGTANNVVDNTTALGSLPDTGFRFIILPIIAIAIVGFVFYKKYTKYSF